MIVKTNNQVPSNGIHCSKTFPSSQQTSLTTNFCEPDQADYFYVVQQGSFSVSKSDEAKEGQSGLDRRSCCWNCQTLGQLGKNMFCFFLIGGRGSKFQGFLIVSRKNCKVVKLFKKKL